MASSEMDRMMSCSVSEPVVAESKLAMFGRSDDLLVVAELNEYHLSKAVINVKKWKGISIKALVTKRYVPHSAVRRLSVHATDLDLI